jgi:hypothetical protein
VTGSNPGKPTGVIAGAGLPIRVERSSVESVVNMPTPAITTKAAKIRGGASIKGDTLAILFPFAFNRSQFSARFATAAQRYHNQYR